MKRSMLGGMFLMFAMLGLLLMAAGTSQAANGGCAQVAKPAAPAAGPNVAQAAPAPRSYSYRPAPSTVAPRTAAPATARPAQQPVRRYSYSPGYTNRANMYRVPAAPYENSPRYLHADAKARGWHFRYSRTTTD